MEPKGCPETSVRNYHYSLRNNPEERSSQAIKCLNNYIYIYIYIFIYLFIYLKLSSTYQDKMFHVIIQSFLYVLNALQ
jgi:hypothetical protein